MKIDDDKLNQEIERLYKKIQDGTMEQNSTELFTYMWLAELRDRRAEEYIQEIKLKAIELFKKNPENIGVPILQRNLHIGVIKSNKILEALEEEGIVSISKEGKRKLLV